MRRRAFLQRSAMGGALILSGQLPLNALAAGDVVKLTILHTNDTHSRIDPFPEDGSRNAGRGGAARRAALIEEIRQKESNVLLFDAGDIFQGTPYFNMFGGELELKLMTRMKYDASTIGNHDFDAGIEGLHKQVPHADFPFVVSNYDMSDTIMHDSYVTHRVFERDGIKVGVFGLGIELDGLVPQSLYGNTRYLDPVEKANETASHLRNDLECDYIICLSHLGFRYRGDKISDVALAGVTRDVDLIIGGHTHTFLDRPEVVLNRGGQPTYINQVGWAGLRLGRIDVYFEKRRGRRTCVVCDNRDI